MAPVPHLSDLSAIEHWSRSLILPLPALQPRETAGDIFSHLHNALRRTSASITSLAKRQTIADIPQLYSNVGNSPQPGVVAGIVLGSVGGTLIILWLIYTIMSVGGPRPSADEVEIIQRRSRSPPRRASRSRRAESRSEVIEVARHRTPPPPRRREREIIVEETTTRRQSAPPPEEFEDDIVEVIEEHSPPPQRRSRRASSGYRNVDPDEYGGGSRRMRPVR
ncbi:MAG: hypothetical protein LQ340_006451 [Diploschistes diacapsis]|nr:MAG: hypothetical protein LQ340_006451 [Diploschistes diacapsis]